MKKIVIVGVGALGSHVVQFVRNEKVSLRVIDFDRVEQKNVLSQFHSKPSVGKNKTIGLQQSMQFLFGYKLEGVPHKLTWQNNVQLLEDADLIVDCLDNGESRRLVQGFARSAFKPCVHGALAADGMFGRVVWDENFSIDDDAAGAATCEDGQHLPFIGIVSTFLARSIQAFLANGAKWNFNITPTGVSRF